ncbi:MAG: adenosine-specific kinase [Synergistes sp.]|nr:adenosine-specific kinase [Synergistes sp.]
MTGNVTIKLVQADIPEDANIIVGQSHFIKTVEDLYEVLVTSSPVIEFGIAFCEASGDCLIRHDGNNKEMEDAAVENASKINAGHVFVIAMRKGFPINVLDRVKNTQEVCRVFAATANPLQIVIAESEQGRGVVGVIDGFTTKGTETDKDIADRKRLLRDIIGYKR